MLTKYVHDKKNSWDDFIDTCVFAYNTSKHESTTFTPFELMFGRKAYLPVDVDLEKATPEQLLDDWQEASYTTVDVENAFAARKQAVKDAKCSIKKAQGKQKYHYDLKHFKPCVYDVGRKVLLKDFTRKKRKGGKLDRKWIGPYEIKKNLGRGLYALSAIGNPSVSVKRVTGAQLKPYLTPPESPLKIDPSISHHSSDLESSMESSFFPTLSSSCGSSPQTPLSSSFASEKSSLHCQDCNSSSEPLNTSLGLQTPVKRSPYPSSLETSTPIKRRKMCHNFLLDVSPIKSESKNA